MRYLAVVCAALFFASIAAAHTMGPNGGRVYQSPGLCVTDYAQLGHGNGGGRVDGSIETDREISIGIGGVGVSLSCAQARTMSPGYLLYRLQYLFWGPYSSSWSVCQDTGWGYNGGFVSYLSVTRDFSQYYGGWHPPCGEGYYYAYFGGWAYDGGWQPMTSAAWVGVGYHYFFYWN